jgi:hypothetical protein
MKRPIAAQPLLLVVLFLAFSAIEIFSQSVPQPVLARLPASARLAQPLARMGDTQPLSIALTLPFHHPEALTNLLREIQDPKSPNYRHYLTREEFTKRFGPTEEEYGALKQFAVTHGLAVHRDHANRMLLEVGGTVGDIQRAFHTTLRVYRHPTEARTFYAPDTEPSIDFPIKVLSVRGLDNYELARPRVQAVPLDGGRAEPNGTGSGPGGGFRGNDFRAAYVPDTSLTGAGQVVGLLQFDGYSADDITYYQTNAGLPSITLSNVLLNGASGNPSGNGGEVEVTMDIEMVMSMAPGLSQIIVYEAPNPTPFEVILNRMVSDNAARQLSCSWFLPSGSGNPAAEQIFQEMAAQGQSFFNASGDNDAFTGLIDFPSDSPNITQVGGTTLTTSGPGGYRVSETAWNKNNGIGTGGGISTQYGIPSWQTNIDMSVNQGSTTMRNVPDVSLTAENIYVRVNGVDMISSGTSASAPLWAGFAALANQEAAAAGQPSLGFINPLIYQIAYAPNHALHFFDITNGDNTKMTSPNRFFATNGYDLCTGWGTPKGQRLIDVLAIVDPLHIAPSAGFATAGGAGGPFTVTSQNLTVTNGGTNALHWTVTKNGTWFNVSTAGGTLSPGSSTTVAVTLNSVASNLTVGTYYAALLFTNLDTQLSFERDYSITILSPPAITNQPTDEAVLDGDTASFTVEATGSMPLYYQWRRDGTNLVEGGNFMGTTTTNLTINNVSPADLGTYSVVITNQAASVTSSNAVLSIMDSAPVITLQPADQNAEVGTSAIFTVAAIGNKPFYYQWSYNDWNSVTNIDGATNASLILTNLQLTDSGFYSVTVSNSIGAAPDAGATLTVYELPAITSQPTDLVVAVRSNAQFSVSVSGTGPFNFQWYQNSTNALPGNGSTFFLPDAEATDAGLYNVVVTSPFGQATSSNAMLTVTGFDHFGWSPIPSPRFVNGQIAVTIRALDTTNAPFTNFAGTVQFDSTNGADVYPAVSDNFTNGVWSGSIWTDEATSNLVLRANDGDGRIGLANAIDVVAAPSLSTLGSNGSLLLNWPTAPGGFALETSTNLLPDSWTAVPGSPTNSDDLNFQWVPITKTNQFFRLRFLGP